MSVPADSDGITPDWLTAALREAGAISHTRVTSIQSGPVGHMGMTGQLCRLQIRYDRAEPGAPRSLLAKFSARHPEVRATVHSIGFYEREIGFYREFAADCPVRTPRCYFGEVEMDSGASLLLLEDLTWMRNLNSAGGVLDEVELVIRELGKLHAAWWGAARLDQTPWLPMKGIMTPDQAPVVLRAHNTAAGQAQVADRAFFRTRKRSIVTGPDCLLLNGSRSILPRPEVEKRTPSPSSTGKT